MYILRETQTMQEVFECHPSQVQSEIALVMRHGTWAVDAHWNCAPQCGQVPASSRSLQEPHGKAHSTILVFLNQTAIERRPHRQSALLFSMKEGS
jgi:hypothetical protein